MKDIKSMIIGFLLATCMFLFMGNTSIYGVKYDSVGKYQMSSGHINQAYMIDTINGQLFHDDGGVWKETIKPNSFRYRK